MRRFPTILSIILAGASAAACAVRAAKPPVATAASSAAAGPPVEFTPVPEAEAAKAKSPHDLGGKPLCQGCHVRGQPGVKTDAIALCAGCHDAGHMRHPFRVLQSPAPPNLPLMANGDVACHTCHDAHDVRKNRSGLRVPFDVLCLECHTKHENKRPAERSP